MTGFDSRIVSGFLGLGLDNFPFAAYDGAGRLKIPDSVDFPTHVQEGVGKVVKAPIWSSLYKTMTVLDDPTWNTFSAGIGFNGRNVTVAIFKGMSSVPDAEAAAEWTYSYTTVVARTIRQFAGKQYVIDPAWISAANAALDNLPASEKKNDPAGEQGEGEEGGEDEGAHGTYRPIISELEHAEGLAAAAFVPWLLMGLRSILALLEKYAPSPGVRTTVWWYPAPGQQVTQQLASSWTPMHTDYRYDGALRTVSGIWDPAHRAFWASRNVNWKDWGWAMPHEPWMWCRSFYPIGRCGGPGLVPATDELVTMIDPAVGLVIPADATDGLPFTTQLAVSDESAVREAAEDDSQDVHG
jgi:hypothetical protein